MKKLHTEKLFDALDENYEIHYKDKTFWKKFHALDKELIPGGIFLETFHEDTANPWSAAEFKEGQENTLVIRLKNQEAVEKLAQLMAMFFRDTGVRFVPETIMHEGKPVHQIRSNIDKAQWSRLAVFCKYRFEREITDKSEQTELKKECHKAVVGYLQGARDWDGGTGLPACISVLGTPGILRPMNPDEADPERKFEEINGQHPHGTPLIYRGKVVHVDLKKDGTITGIPTAPYEYGFDIERHLMAESVEGVKENQGFLQMLRRGTQQIFMEATGLSFLAREVPLANRILRLGIVGVSAWAFATEGRTEPFVCLAIGEAGLIVAYVNNKWKSYGTAKQLEENPSSLLNDMKVMQTIGPSHSTQPMDAETVLKQALTPEKANQLQRLVREENKKLSPEDRVDPQIIENITKLEPKHVEDRLGAGLISSAFNIPRL